MPAHQITIDLRGNMHDPLCTEEAVARCICGWQKTFCESCPDSEGRPQEKQRHTNLGEALWSHLLRSP